MPDESIFGLLIRAHAEVSAQAHGEEFLHHNERSAQYWAAAQGAIEVALSNVTFAEQQQRIQEARKSWEKEKPKP